jgi:tryptophanyl-tRNA synthetase
VEGNPVFIYHRAFNPNRAEVEDLTQRYRAGKVGDVEVKTRLVEALNAFLDPIRARREHFAGDPRLVQEILGQGTQKMRAEAQATMDRVHDAMGLFHLPE